MRLKKGVRAFCLLLIMALIGAMFVPAVSAGTGDDNDASFPEVGVEWVNDYWPNPLSHSDESATDFYNTLGNAGWTKRFCLGDRQTAVNQWSDNDENYVDGVDITWFSGHGHQAYLLLTNNPLDWVQFNLVEWGDYDAEWMLLHSCHTTEIPGNFKGILHKALNGVHLICGFNTIGYDFADDGENCAQRLLNSEKVRLAWFNAMDETHPDTIKVGIIGENSNCGNDRIWKEGTVIADPTVDDTTYYWLYYCN
ncbi:DUF6345 domain-containing protein [Methanoplanus limicola]|nr:DUF6345 domain-containing protein [Methanoplanus limicola]